MRKSAFVGACVLLVSAKLFAQRPPPDTLPASGGSVTTMPLRHGTVGIIHDRQVILVDPVREFDDPPFDVEVRVRDWYLGIPHP